MAPGAQLPPLVAPQLNDQRLRLFQLYSGTVIARDGEGSNETFTVRRVSYGEGVERIFPINAPSIVKIEVEKFLTNVRAA